MESPADLLVTTFFKNYPSEVLDPAQVLIQAGDVPPGVMYLETGLVRQFALTKEGTERTLNLYKPGSFFPMSWALNQTPNRHTFETVLTSEVKVAPHQDVVEFLHAHPEVTFNLLQRMFKALDGLLLQIEQRSSGDAYHILVATIVLLARRFGRSSESGTQIALPLTHTTLANQAGLSRETVSRTLQKCKNQGLLTFTSRIINIPNLKALEAELE
jgi:CRP-like cAMP-binding protein